MADPVPQVNNHPESCPVEVANDGHQRLVEDPCLGESRVEPVPPNPPKVSEFCSMDEGQNPDLVCRNDHFSRPIVARNFCEYDPSLNFTFDPNFIDSYQIYEMGRQANSCDPDQQAAAIGNPETGQEGSLTYAIKNHPEEVALALNEVQETYSPEQVAEVRQGVQTAIQMMSSDAEANKESLQTFAVHTADPELRREAIASSFGTTPPTKVYSGSIEEISTPATLSHVEPSNVDHSTVRTTGITLEVPVSSRTLPLAPEGRIVVADSSEVPSLSITEVRSGPSRVTGAPRNLDLFLTPETYPVFLNELDRVREANNFPDFSSVEGRGFFQFLSQIPTDDEGRGKLAGALLEKLVLPARGSDFDQRLNRAASGARTFYIIKVAFDPRSRRIQIEVRAVEGELARGAGVEESPRQRTRRGTPSFSASGLGRSRDGTPHDAPPHTVFVPVPPQFFAPRPRPSETQPGGVTVARFSSSEKAPPAVTRDSGTSDHHSGEGADDGNQDREQGEEEEGEG